MPDPKPIGRASVTDHTWQAATAAHDDAHYAALIATEASRLEPLHRIQLTLDQAARHADDRRLGLPWPFDISFGRTMDEALKAAGHYCDVLICAAEAARTMIDSLSKQLGSVEAPMSAENPNEGPKLTTTGEPHPLQAGGYDAANDPGLPSNISDVEAQKEGKQTHMQAEAMGRADTADGGEPTKADPSGAPTPTTPAPTTAAPATPQTSVAPNAGEMPHVTADDAHDEPKKGRSKK